MLTDISRRTFVKGSAAAGAGLATGGPIAAYAARTQKYGRRHRADGYGPLQPAGAIDSGVAYLALAAASSTA